MCFCCSTSCSSASCLYCPFVFFFSFALFSPVCILNETLKTLGETQRNPKEILIRTPDKKPLREPPDTLGRGMGGSSLGGEGGLLWKGGDLLKGGEGGSSLGGIFLRGEGGSSVEGEGDLLKGEGGSSLEGGDQGFLFGGGASLGGKGIFCPLRLMLP